MKKTAEELAKTFTVKIDDTNSFMELKFVSEDVGKENVDIQSDLIYDAIIDFNEQFPEIVWKVLVDTATTKVYTMSLYSAKKYEELMKRANTKKIALLVDSTEKQGKITEFALATYAKFNKKVSIFTSREEAELWLNL